MNLMMFLGNELIESVPLEDDKISIPGYLGKFKRNLKVKYRELISQHSAPPDFLVTSLLPQTKQELFSFQ